MGYKPQVDVLPPAIRWGCDNEPLARKAYVASMKERGCDVQVSDCGLHLHYKYGYLGASSHGAVVDHSLDDLCCGCLEVKCPFSIGGHSVVHMSPMDITKKFRSQFCLELDGDGGLHLKKGHVYYDHLMGEMAAICVDWCDFVVYTSGGLFIERVSFDPEYWNRELFPALERFYLDNIVPELICGDLWFSSYVAK